MRKYVAFTLGAVLSILAAAQEVDLNALAGEEWYGLYMNGQKVGYSHNAIDVAEDGSVTVEDDASFKLNMVGMKQDMRIYNKRTYGPDGDLKTIESKVDDIAGTNEFSGVVEGDKLVFHSKVGGQETTRELPKPDESILDAVKQAEMVLDDPQIGKTVEFSLFEPMYETEIRGTSELIDIEERVLDGITTKTYKVKTVLDVMNIESVSVVSEDGTVLEDHVAGGIVTMRLEPEAVAKDVSYSNDVIVSNAAKVARLIENPRDRPTLRLRINGPLAEDQLFNNAAQSIAREDGEFLFEGRKLAEDSIESVQLPVKNEEVKEWLEPTLFVQSDSPRLVEKAQEIVGDEKDAFAVSSKLVNWVYENVRTTFSARLTNSLEVLDHMEGDCTEHSMLFIGLARAAGLPAREVAGLIYVDSPEPGFYFHQWAMVWVGQWIDVDPTFNQPIADATHIKLGEGDLFEQTRLLPIIGKLHIEVLDDEAS